MSKENQYNLLQVIGVLFRWKKQLTALVVATTLSAVLVSLLLDDYYTAYATFVPTNEEQKLFDSAGNLTLYGDDDAVSRVLVFAESTPFINYMIDKFNLAERYNIDQSSPKGRNKVEKKFKKLLDVRRNKHSGLEIAIQDKDPQFAYEMIQGALSKIEELYRNATSANKELIKQTYENAIQEKERELIIVADTLTRLRKKFNIFDVESQSEALSVMLSTTEAALAVDEAKLESFIRSRAPKDSIIKVTARIAGANKQIKLMRGEIKGKSSSADIIAFNKGRDLIIYWETKINNLNEELSLIITQFAKFKTHAYSNIAGIIQLEPARVPNLKSYPVRSLIVLSAFILSIIFGVIGIILIDIYRKVNWDDVLYNEDEDQ